MEGDATQKAKKKKRKDQQKYDVDEAMTQDRLDLIL